MIEMHPGRITKPLALRADLQKDWRRLRFPSSEVALAISHANELHARGCLFTSVVPDPEEK